MSHQPLNMRYFRVKNWERYQQYKDRSPKWIKLYRDLNHNYEWTKLREVQRAHLMGIWLLAAELGNKIPFDPKWVGGQISAFEKVDIEQLVTLGFLEEYISVQKVTGACTGVYLEREGEGEEEEERDKKEKPSKKKSGQAPCDYEGLVSLWNEMMVDEAVPHCREFSSLKANLKSRWISTNQHPGRDGVMVTVSRDNLSYWRRLFASCKTSDLLMGRVAVDAGRETPWRMSLGWLLKLANFEKVVNGNYWPES